MKVLILAKSCYRLPTSQGGSDTAALREAMLLSSRGHRVTLIGLGKLSEEAVAVDFVPVPSRVEITSDHPGFYFFKGFVLACLGLVEAIKELRGPGKPTQVINTHTSLSVPILKLLFPHIPIVYTIHDPLYLEGGRARGVEALARVFNNNLLERMAFRSSDKVIAVSDSIKQQAIKVGLPASKASTLYPLPAPETNNPDSPISDLPSSVSEPYFLSVGAQMGRKRFDRLIEAMPRLEKEIGLVLVGNGSDRPRLVETARVHGVERRIQFLDSVDTPTLSQLYRHAFLYILVSEREGFPATIREALQHGTPAIYVTPDAASMIPPVSEGFLRVLSPGPPTSISNLVHDAYIRSRLGQLDRSRIRRWSDAAFPSVLQTVLELEKVLSDSIRTGA